MLTDFERRQIIARLHKSAPVIESYVDNPDHKFSDIAKQFGISVYVVSKYLKDYYLLPPENPVTITLQSKINESN